MTLHTYTPLTNVPNQCPILQLTVSEIQPGQTFSPRRLSIRTPWVQTIMRGKNAVNALVLKLQVILLIMEGTEKSENNDYSLSYWNRHPSYSPCCSY